MNYRQKIFDLSLAAITALSIAGALVYRAYSLNWPGIITSVFLAALILVIIHRLFAKYNVRPGKPVGRPARTDTGELLSYAVYIGSYALALFMLIKSRSDAAIISPWQVVPAYFFPAFFTLSLSLFWIIFRRYRFWQAALSLYYFLSFSVALIVYRLGFGFDPFVHQATLELIDKTGSVMPKPFYYLGQYGLIIILHKLLFLPLSWLNTYLAPALAAVFLPEFLRRLISSWLPDNPARYFPLLLILAFPAGLFIISTPQNLAWLWLIIAILLSPLVKNWFQLALLLLLSLAALAAHPIAGLPALLLFFGVALEHSESKKYKKFVQAFLLLILVASLPLSFLLVSGGLPSANRQAPAASGGGFDFSLPGREDIIYNSIYLYSNIWPLFLVALAAAGIYLAYKYRAQGPRLSLYLYFGLGLVLSYLITRMLPFDFLIDYERADYSRRVLITACLFFLPFLLLSLYLFMRKVNAQSRAVRCAWYVFLALILSASLYLGYPRFDPYHNSHLYAVSAPDLKAVEWIEARSEADYIVLANQQVSAAALKRFGFQKYYPTEYGEVFYYPIPTGGPLYGYYLDMVYEKADRNPVKLAMGLAGVNEAYFVLNKYWWAFDKVRAEAQASADEVKVIGDGEVVVFRYIE